MLRQEPKEETWDIKVAVDSQEERGRCTKRFAQNARKNAKCHLSPEMTAQYTARIVIRNARRKAVKKRDYKRQIAMITLRWSWLFLLKLQSHNQG